MFEFAFAASAYVPASQVTVVSLDEFFATFWADEMGALLEVYFAFIDVSAGDVFCEACLGYLVA